MKARTLGGVLAVYPRYGGRVLFGDSWWEVFRFMRWYVRYLWVWNDPLSEVNGRPL